MDMVAADPEGHPSGERCPSSIGESEGGLRSSSSDNVDGGDVYKEGAVLAIKSIVSRKSSAMSMACSMASGSEGESNMEGAKGGVDVEDGDTDDWERFKDEESGDSYFVHRQSGKSVWERPGEEKG